jgi:hypothetical protein
MALQRTRRPSLRSGRSLRSLGSPLNAYPLGGPGKVRASNTARPEVSPPASAIS